jgi:hypothetical protein
MAKKSETSAPRWHEEWAGRVCTPEAMVRFVNAVGVCTTRPLAGFAGFPCQSEALGPVPPGASDPWFWKDDLHVEKRIYYTRVFKGEPGFLSLEMLPAFIATNGMVVDELLYCGAMTPEAQQVYAAIEAQGPIPIRELKRMLTPDAARSVDRELHALERRFIITKTAISGRTRHTYGYVWDLVERWMPEMLAAADRMGHTKARAVIRKHLAVFGISVASPFYGRVLGWQE